DRREKRVHIDMKNRPRPIHGPQSHARCFVEQPKLEMSRRCTQMTQIGKNTILSAFICVYLRLNKLSLAPVSSRLAFFASDLAASSWLGHSELLSCWFVRYRRPIKCPSP